MLHVKLLRWRNLIGSLSWDKGQYPMIDFDSEKGWAVGSVLRGPW